MNTNKLFIDFVIQQSLASQAFIQDVSSSPSLEQFSDSLMNTKRGLDLQRLFRA